METNANQKVSCVVNYTYDASEGDELTIRPGDVLRDVERLPGGWWRGELRGRRGMFPDNFVTVLTDHGNTRPGGVQGRCRAVFSYQPANPDELPLCVGDVLEVLGEVEEGWWQGRRQGCVGVFPSNFVVMLDPLHAAPPYEPAPALPPKPVREQCRVLFPYAAANDDELTLAEGDIVTIISKDAPDRGWWRGEIHGRIGLFPDNFVQLLPVTQEIEEKKPERPPIKATNSIYPILNKYSEKTASVKELTTAKISLHKENTVSKESSTQSTITHTNKSESEKIIHSETVSDGTLDGQVKKPPVPLKKSPTPTTGVGGLFSGLKSKMLSSDKEKEKSLTTVSSGSSSGGEWDRTDGAAASRPTPANTNSTTNTNTNTFDHIERNSILNDPRAGRVKAPRRRPPSQVLRDDGLVPLELSNGHEVEKPPPDKIEEIRPRTREWEKHKAPWMEELKLNQAKKTSFGADGKSRSVSSSSETSGVTSKAGGGSTDRILDCGLDEKRSTHSMEMSKSTSSISSRLSVLESFEETKVRHSLDSKKDSTPPLPRDEPPAAKPTVQSPTAAGRTLITMLEEVKKPPAPAPPVTSIRTSMEITTDKSPNIKEKTVVSSEKEPSTVKTASGTFEKTTSAFEKHSESSTVSKSGRLGCVFEKTSTVEKLEKEEKVPERPASVLSEKSGSSTLERRLHENKAEKSEGVEMLIAQLNSRISNLEKLLEVQNAKFNAAIEELTSKLMQESEKRQTLQKELEKLSHCVTQV